MLSVIPRARYSLLLFVLLLLLLTATLASKVFYFLSQRRKLTSYQTRRLSFVEIFFFLILDRTHLIVTTKSWTVKFNHYKRLLHWSHDTPIQHVGRPATDQTGCRNLYPLRQSVFFHRCSASVFACVTLIFRPHFLLIFAYFCLQNASESIESAESVAKSPVKSTRWGRSTQPQLLLQLVVVTGSTVLFR